MFNGMAPNLNQSSYKQLDNKPIVIGSVSTDSNAKYNSWAWIGFIMSFCCGIVGSIVCIIALGQIKKNWTKRQSFSHSRDYYWGVTNIIYFRNNGCWFL